jgi:hypothetical protein
MIKNQIKSSKSCLSCQKINLCYLLKVLEVAFISYEIVLFYVGGNV